MLTCTFLSVKLKVFMGINNFYHAFYHVLMVFKVINGNQVLMEVMVKVSANFLHIYIHTDTYILI